MSTPIEVTYTLAAIAALTLALGCKTEDNNYPPIAGHTEAEPCDTTSDEHLVCSSATTDPTAADESGGECGQFGIYDCRGWVAAVYKNGSTERFDFDGVSPDGTLHAECARFDLCMAFDGYPDSATIYAACREACAGMDWGFPSHPFSGSVGEAWDLDRIECVFADDAQLAVIPEVVGDFYGGCSWVPENSTDYSKTEQVLFKGCVEPDFCAAEREQSCAGWDPGAEITSSLNSLTRTYTTTVDHAWLDALMADMLDPLYVCDSGGWTWSIAASPDKWRMQDLVSSDMLYKLGFRNGDEQLRIKRSGGSTWYNLHDTTMLGGYDKTAVAFGALVGETSFVIEFKRKSGSVLVTYTMNLALV